MQKFYGEDPNKNLRNVSSISDSSIELILHFIETKSMLVDPLEAVSVVRNTFGWKGSALLVPRGRKLTLTTKVSRRSQKSNFESNYSIYIH